MTFRLIPSTAPICSSGNWWPSAARIWARLISRDGCKPLERSASTALRSDLDKWISIRCMAPIYGPLLTCQCTSGALGHIGRGADGDADFGLAEGGRVVDSVARHAGHVPRSLQMLHHGIF